MMEVCLKAFLPALMWILSHLSMYTCCSAIFWISVRGIAPYVALILVCPLEGQFRSRLCHLFGTSQD